MQRDGLAARVRELEAANAALQERAERASALERLLAEASAGREAAEAARARLLHTREELATSLLARGLSLPSTSKRRAGRTGQCVVQICLQHLLAEASAGHEAAEAHVRLPRSASKQPIGMQPLPHLMYDMN